MNPEIEIVNDINPLLINPTELRYKNAVVVKMVCQGHSRVIYDLAPESGNVPLWLEKERNCTRIYTDAINLFRTYVCYGVLALMPLGKGVTSMSLRGLLSMKWVLCTNPDDWSDVAFLKKSITTDISNYLELKPKLSLVKSTGQVLDDKEKENYHLNKILARAKQIDW